MSEQNLTEFLMNILNGIQYGNISSTSRTYQWMKNNNHFEGPCLNALKNYITNENLLTQKEVDTYQKLVKENSLSTEQELDEEFAAYMNNTIFGEFEDINVESYTNILEQSQNYLKELNLAEKLLEKKKSDLEVQISSTEKKKNIDEDKIKYILKQSDEMNLSYNETLKKVQQELSKISLNFNKLINEDGCEEHNVFRINFEVFKQINSKFRETVNTVIQKQFNKSQKVDVDVESQNSSRHESDVENGIDYSKKGYVDVDEEKNKIETLTQIAFSLGEQNFRSVKYKCEEAAFKQLNDFITNLLSDINCKSIISMGNARLQSQTALNLETLDDVQQQLLTVSQNLEKYYTNYVFNEIFTSEYFRIEHKLENDKKRLSKVFDLCSKFVDLLTLQGLLFQNEKENVNLAVEIYDQAVTELEAQCQKHSNLIFHLKNMIQNEEITENSDENLSSLSIFKSDFLNLKKTSEENSSFTEILQKYSLITDDVKNQILGTVESKLKTFSSLKNSIKYLDNIIFNGPAKQPFFIFDLVKDKILIELQWDHFNKMFRSLKKDYKDELDKLSSDEYVKIEKSLWISFLIDHQALQDNYNTLKENAGINKTLIMRKANNSTVFVKKPNLSSYY